MVFVVSLAALAGTWLLTHSEAAQFLVLFPSIYLPAAFLRRRVEGPDEHAEVAAGLLPPWRLLLFSLPLVAPLGVAVYFLSDLIELGLFWFIALMWVWGEVYATLVRREIEHHGTATWKPERPLRDAASAGLLTAPIIAAMLLLFDSSAPLSEAILAGVACGVIVAALGLFFNWLDRRARPSG